jgi:hypothetical protein
VRRGRGAGHRGDQARPPPYQLPRYQLLRYQLPRYQLQRYQLLRYQLLRYQLLRGLWHTSAAGPSQRLAGGQAAWPAWLRTSTKKAMKGLLSSGALLKHL